MLADITEERFNFMLSKEFSRKRPLLLARAVGRLHAANIHFSTSYFACYALLVTSLLVENAVPAEFFSQIANSANRNILTEVTF